MHPSLKTGTKVAPLYPTLFRLSSAACNFPTPILSRAENNKGGPQAALLNP
jgi:hypothetical protein